jgi:hypothetical protein
MGGNSPLSAARTVLVDANVFFAIGRPPNSKYVRFRREIQSAGVVLKLPRRVVGELGGPETERIRTAVSEGWAEIIDPPAPTDAAAMRASDIARWTIADETGQPEHEVEKTDTILAGLAIQYVRDSATTDVTVLTDDKPAAKAITNAISAQGYTDAITVYGVSDIIGDESDDSMRLI